MERKKMIGAIIGVTLFAALMAGATYAWLSATVNVTRGNYNAATGNFVIDYNDGAAGGTIENVPIVSTPSKSSLVTAEAFKEITANLATGSISGKLTIKLTTTVDNLLTKSGALNYAICVEEDCAEEDLSDADVTGTINTTNVGTTTDEGYTYEKVLYADPSDLETTQKSYFVYFWLDGTKITNAMVEQDGQNEYSGYIHASAEQSH